MDTVTITTEDIQPVIPAQPRPFFSGTMPVPPSINDAYMIIKTRDKGRITGMRIGPTPALDQFKHDAPLMLSQGYCDWALVNAIRNSKIKVPLAVEMRVYFRTPWKRDLDDVVKFAIDAAFERLELNDNLVVDLHPIKLVDEVEPRVEIEIRCVVR